MCFLDCQPDSCPRVGLFGLTGCLVLSSQFLELLTLRKVSVTDMTDQRVVARGRCTVYTCLAVMRRIVHYAHASERVAREVVGHDRQALRNLGGLAGIVRLVLRH